MFFFGGTLRVKYIPLGLERTLSDLKQRKREQISAIPEEIMQQALGNLGARLAQTLRNG
jgi:hypothetical protein